MFCVVLGVLRERVKILVSLPTLRTVMQVDAGERPLFIVLRDFCVSWHVCLHACVVNHLIDEEVCAASFIRSL